MSGLDDLRRLQDTARSLVREPRPAIGMEETGTVEVRVDETGRLDAVEIHRDWRRRLSPEAVAPAVLAAAGDALTKQATAWAEAMQSPPPPVRPAAGPTAPPVRPRFEQAPDPRLHELLWTVTEAFAELRAYTEHAQAAAQRTTTGRSHSGRVTVTLTGSHLTTVEIDERWLRSEASGRQMADEIEAACRQAYRAIAADDEAAAAGTPHLNEVRELARDSQNFIRRVTGD
ncbi:DNA-binding protein YbaB [Actinoplanes campanulatus]|uniref:DNA-binding protein YbaB n=1 Tax=Actinoplanes campanulatus TaxID=113559 RepID=A0A7W5FCX0_9ACTN|nr:YbaB/EbfC family nucleoid-associated protein [Actinoplanes campanulatus]MBB3093819.1 DNA-binding protein YbaB [Actinoplanes campanulatus]